MTPTAFCQLVENRLGWSPPPGGPAYRRYVVEAAKVKRKIASNPELYTWAALELAVELLARERLPRTPIGVFSHVERALTMARLPETDLEEQIRSAMRYEGLRGDPGGWVTRFTRATGPYRAEVLDEWRRAVL